MFVFAGCRWGFNDIPPKPPDAGSDGPSDGNQQNQDSAFDAEDSDGQDGDLFYQEEDLLGDDGEQDGGDQAEDGGEQAPCRYHFRKLITTDPAKVAADLINFPTLISMPSDPDLAANARADGFDIVFTDSSGNNRLKHELEFFDKATGQVVAWVLLPQLSSLGPTTFYLDAGDDTITAPTEDPHGVWDANYVAVWHLTETGTGQLNEYEDSSNYGNHGQGGGWGYGSLFVPTRVPGAIGYAQDFGNSDGKYDEIDCSNDSSLYISGNQITLQAWVRHNIVFVSGESHGVFNLKGWDFGYRLTLPDNRLNLNFQLPGSTHLLESAMEVGRDAWHQVVGTYDGQKMRVYIDGQKDIVELDKTDNIIPPQAGEHFLIGYGDQALDTPWDYEWGGQIDEVRISVVARSEAWIGTEYNNQNSPGTFFQLGPFEEISHTCP